MVIPDKRKLYITKDPDGIYGLAIGVGITSGGMLGWVEDRGHMFDGKVVNETPDGFDWEVPEGKGIHGVWKFRIATVSSFERVMRPIIDPGFIQVPRFKTDDDLHEWYRRRLLGT
jgi:hypothetical protein